MVREYGKVEGNREIEVVSILKRYSFLGNWSFYLGIIVIVYYIIDVFLLMIVF